MVGYELENEEAFKRALQMLVFNNNPCDHEDLKRVLLDGARYIGDMQAIKTEEPEFIEWKWIDYNLLPEVIVEFKKEVYKKLKIELRNFFN